VVHNSRYRARISICHMVAYISYLLQPRLRASLSASPWAGCILGSRFTSISKLNTPSPKVPHITRAQMLNMGSSLIFYLFIIRMRPSEIKASGSSSMAMMTIH